MKILVAPCVVIAVDKCFHHAFNRELGQIYGHPGVVLRVEKSVAVCMCGVIQGVMSMTSACSFESAIVMLITSALLID